MSDPHLSTTASDREAADWFARLGSRSVSNEAMAEFEAWRRAPENREAYRRMERVWEGAGRLSSDPDLREIGHAALKRGFRSPTPNRRAITWTAIAAVGVSLVVGGVFWQNSARTEFSTDVGQQRLVDLPDGSTVRLDTDSAIRVQYSRGRRTIALDRGQALFQVAHDQSRPFTVDAGTTSVTATGTIFDVRRRQGDVHVVLVSGAVDVRAPTSEGAKTWQLKPGRRVDVTEQGVVEVAADPATATSWALGRLVFQDTPLIEAVAEINRYLPEKIVLDASELNDTKVNGVFEVGDRSAFVAAAGDLFGLQAHDQPDGSVRLTPSGENKSSGVTG